MRSARESPIEWQPIRRAGEVEEETSSANDHPNGVLTNCRVCSAVTSRNHYAAFFRRTCKERRNYFCSKENCKVAITGRQQKTCKRCRFLACIRMGMLVEAVWKRSVLDEGDQFRELPVLQRLLRARKGTFVNKLNLMSKLAKKLNIKVELGSLKPSLQQTELSKESEFDVLLQYMRDAGFAEMGLDFSDQVKVAVRVFYRWLFLSSVMSSLRNGGHHDQTVYFSDQGRIPVKYDECFDFIRSHQVKHVHVLSRAWYELFLKGMEKLKRVHAAHLDRTEFALLTFLLVAQQAKELFPRNWCIPARMNAAFKQLREHYGSDEWAIRLDTLVLLLNEVNEIEYEIQQFAALLLVSGYETILQRIRRSHGLLSTH